MKTKSLLTLFLGLFLISNAYALDLPRVKTWAAGEILTAGDLNAEFNNILNHAITNNDISATAGILGSKLNQVIAGAIGSTTPNTGAFTTLSSTGATTIGDATGDAFTINPSAWTLSNAVTVTGTWANLGTVTTVDINGGSIDGATLGGSSAVILTAATGVTTFSAGGNLDIGTYALRANTLESDVATGTAPLTVASTTKVTNLNADLLDGFTSSEFSFKQLFTSSGTFTAPTGVTAVYVTMCGGGGGGGSGATTGGGGGGGAQTIIKRKIAVTAGNNYAVTVGTGGAGGASGDNGGVSGVASSFVGASETVTALAGIAGAAHGAGGSGGGSIDGLSTAGGGMGKGGNGAAGATGVGGGGGGCFGLGVGGAGVGAATNGGIGIGYGSGGGGCTNYTGGNGANGFVLVEW
jgi:hypothetical protein